MRLERGKFILKVSPTAPTDHVLLVPVPGSAFNILLFQWKFMQPDKKGRCEGIVVFLVSNIGRVHVPTNDVNM